MGWDSLELDEKKGPVRKQKRIDEFADELGMDTDDVLVTLWDAGVEEFDSPDDIVPGRQIRRVEKLLGVRSYRERLQMAHWQNVSGLSRDELMQPEILVLQVDSIWCALVNWSADGNRVRSLSVVNLSPS